VLVILKRKSRPVRARKRTGPMGVAKTVRQVGAAMAGGSGELRRGWLAFNSGRARERYRDDSKVPAEDVRKRKKESRLATPFRVRSCS
jgi:hypothetical protein